MPSNFGSSDSKWSSERERKERDRQRDAQKELMRQARLEREEKEAREAKEAEARAAAAADAEAALQANPAGTGGDETPRRRLSAAEREAIRKLRGEDADEPADTSAGAPETATGTGKSRVGRRWRSAVEETSAGAGAALPDLPGDPKGGASRSSGKGITSSRLLIFGAILFVAMAIVAFLPFGPFGGGGSTPTPTATEERIIAPSGTLTVNGTPRAKVTAPSDSNTVVCIDPGHGGWDYGFQRTRDKATTRGPAMNESEINLAMGYMLKERLESEGIKVVMTRMSGTSADIYGTDVNGDGRTVFDNGFDEQAGSRDDIQQRINICNEAHADILISLHINGYPDTTVRGYEVLYTAAPIRPFGDLSAELANAVYRRMSTGMTGANYSGNGRNVKSDSDLEANRHGYGTADHLLLTGPAIDKPGNKIVPSNMPGIVCEPVFISNEDDAHFIADPKNQQMLVNAYADGILDYFAKNPG